MTDGQHAGWGRRAYTSGTYGKDDPHYHVTIIETNTPVEAGETLDVEVEVNNLGGAGEQDVTLTVEEQ